ncbi:hypothetical protein SNE40_012262 [Patella caerulea]|uniref:Hexosyltransferase n=2 Tax=Patella caerulea TaxID=87958 RepID=A0AAN8PLS9_PATCE
MHIARKQASLDLQNSRAKRVKFKARESNVQTITSDDLSTGKTQMRIPIWNPGDYDRKRSDMPKCVVNAKFLVLITTAPGNIDRRTAIRKTWCNPYASEHSKDSWQCVFLIGASNNQSIVESVTREKAHYQDILHGSYIDSYRNLTYKVFNSFTWSRTYCPLEYVIKTDDDCFVNTKLVYRFLTTHNTKTTNLYVGKIFLEADKRDVIRNSFSKWKVSKDVYAPNTFPPYASGTGYIMSQDVIAKVVEECRYHTPIPVEDAYTGIVIDALHINPKTSARFMPFSSGLSICNYLYMFVTHNVEPDRQSVMHHNMLIAKSECPGDVEETTWF